MGNNPQGPGDITSTGSANILLVADSMLVTTVGAATSTIDVGDNKLTVRPKTFGTRIDLGGADVHSGSLLALGLDDAELNRFTAVKLIIDNSVSGAVPLSAAIVTVSAAINCRSRSYRRDVTSYAAG